MKRFNMSAAVGTFLLFATSCSNNEPGSSGSNSGGTVAASTGVGASGAGSSVVTSGGSTGAGGSGVTIGSGGATNSGSVGGTVGFGGISASGGAGGKSSTSSASGGTATSTASGGVSGSTGSSVLGGNGGASTTKGGTTGTGGAGPKGGATGIAGAGTGGKAGVGGATGSSGKAGVGGATGSSGKAGVGGATGTAGAPGSVPSTGCGKATTLKSGRTSIEFANVADKTREYILALPTNYDPNHPYKLVFAWHPWMGSAQMIANGGYYGLQKEANNEAIFVAGEGLNFTQGGQSGLGWGNASGEDIAFYHAMLDRFRSELCIDEARIFSVGFSFGAMFSFTLGCTAESMTRAIVPMAGNTMTSGGCASGTRSVAVMALIGLEDTLLDGHRQAVTTYTKRDGCTATTATMNPSWCDGLSSTNLPCTCVNYQGCSDGYPVISCEYTAGHQQAPNPGPIWDFLSQF